MVYMGRYWRSRQEARQDTDQRSTPADLTGKCLGASRGHQPAELRVQPGFLIVVARQTWSTAMACGWKRNIVSFDSSSHRHLSQLLFLGVC